MCIELLGCYCSFFLKVDLPGEADVKVLENVSRQNSGVYQCTSTDMETFEELLNTTTVSVNCKRRHCQMIWNYWKQNGFHVSTLLSVCKDLDAAVVTPRENVSMAMGQELEATCNALSSLQTQTVWLKVQSFCAVSKPCSVLHIFIRSFSLKCAQISHTVLLCRTERRCQRVTF